MDRRMFLRTVAVTAGVLGAGGALSGCSERAEVPDGPPNLNFIPGSFFPLIGDAERIAFGLTDQQNQPIEAEQVELFTRIVGGEITGGPYAADYHPDAAGIGLYVARADLAEAGQVEFVAVTGDGYGAQVLNVIDPADSQVPTPGQPAVSTPTPTAADDLGVARICTQDPPCGMHEVSLEDALAAGRPIVLLFATPAYCQTVVCGPAVATVDEIRAGGEWGDVAFIHGEIYTDQPPDVATFVRAWNLPSEPWLFTIDASGTIAERIDGALIAEEVREVVQGLA